MPEINYYSADGRQTTVEADDGASVMETAIGSGLDGIVAECGGNAMCATCHVYVDDAWLSALPELLDFEDAMLEETISPRTANSRLSCQIPATPDLDGLVVRLPEAQI